MLESRFAYLPVLTFIDRCVWSRSSKLDMNGFRTTPDLSSFGIERLGLSYNEFCGRSPLRDDIWYWQVPSIRACRNQSEDAVATRAIPRRSVLNIQMLRLWDDRLHFVISPVIIVSGPLSPLFQLTTATSVTSTRAPSLSRFSCLSFRTSYRYGSPWSVMARRRSHRSIIGSIKNHPTSSPARHHRCL